MNGLDASGAARVAWLWWERTLVWGGFVGLGGLVGWALPWLTGLLARVPVGPGDLVQQGLDAVPDGWLTPACVVVGALLGAVVAGIGEYEALRVEVTRDEAVLRRKDRVSRIGRAEGAHVFLKAKRLVVLGPDGRERAAEVSDANPARLAAAFEAAGWRGGTATRSRRSTGCGPRAVRRRRRGRRYCSWPGSGPWSGRTASRPTCCGPSSTGSGWCCGTSAVTSTGGRRGITPRGGDTRPRG